MNTRSKSSVAAVAVTALLAAVAAAPATAHTDRSSRDRDSEQQLTLAQARRSAATTLTVGSYNVRFTLSNPAAHTAVDRIMDRADLVGFQEMGGPTRRAMLGSLGRWGTFNPAGGNPVAWDRDKLQFQGGRAFLLAEGRFVGHTPGRRSVFPDYLGTLAKFRDRASGERVAIVNVHAPAHVEVGGRPRADEPHRVAMHRDALRSAARTATSAAAAGYRVFITGDLNVDYQADARHRTAHFPVVVFGQHGFRAAWATQRESEGSLGNRLVDGVWARTRPLAADVLSGFRFSDHKPVVGVYRLPARPRAQQAPPAPDVSSGHGLGSGTGPNH